jgi:hypothetical protein
VAGLLEGGVYRSRPLSVSLLISLSRDFRGGILTEEPNGSRDAFVNCDFATFAAGSIPSTDMPRATKCCSRYPSSLAIAIARLACPQLNCGAISALESTCTGTIGQRKAAGKWVDSITIRSA